ncbi:MAG: very short patch repair endonuclease [Actinomycetota bacterium]|nr:very short patch repair endonuclease [Actinomycetota bacterium]
MVAQHSWASSPERRRIMQAIRGRDTAPELALRRLLHARGLRYRVDSPPLPGIRRRADLVFGPARVAIFVDGCFWHRCPEHATEPRTNVDYWTPKLDRNVERDRETDALLAQAGWVSVRVWEHEDAVVAARRVARIVRRRRARLLAARSSAARDRRIGRP